MGPLLYFPARRAAVTKLRLRAKFDRFAHFLAVQARLVIALALVGAGAAAQSPRLVTLAPDSITDLRAWDGQLDRLVRDGELQVRQVREDTLVAGRTHERLMQVYKGVPVFGGDVARQIDRGQTVSLFGTLYAGIDLDVTPRLAPEDAARIVERLAGVELGTARLPELAILPRDGAGDTLTYRTRVMSANGLTMYFIDARTGDVAFEFSHLQTAVGKGKGVLNDDKKVSADSVGSRFVTRDLLRPPSIATFDMKGDVSRTVNFLNRRVSLTSSDLASDLDNEWTDAAVVDAHAYAGWTHDYLFKRFGRRGLDNNNIEIVSLVHPVKREDVLFQPASIIGLFYLNAFYAGDGTMVYGEGLPPNLTAGGQRWNFLAGALDIVSHELGHGVTDFSSGLIYLNEPGALNEAYSDILAAGVEFFFQQAGSGPQRADYLIGEDVITPGGIRSMDNPAAYGDPDHFSKRFTGTADNGGVHTNANIATHAFYLAIEGGTNRTSGLSVQGVGPANREQIEKVFYRAFVQLLPSNATFAVARAACIQAARDLYGAGSAAERAVTQAWTAVGVTP